MSFSDPAAVRDEYASEAGLVARASVYQGLAGPDARQLAFAAVSDCSPGHVLEVGCGWGEFAARIRDEVTADVVAVDISPRMVELAQERGINASLGDVCALCSHELSVAPSYRHELPAVSFDQRDHRPDLHPLSLTKLRTTQQLSVFAKTANVTTGRTLC